MIDFLISKLTSLRNYLLFLIDELEMRRKEPNFSRWKCHICRRDTAELPGPIKYRNCHMNINGNLVVTIACNDCAELLKPIDQYDRDEEIINNLRILSKSIIRKHENARFGAPPVIEQDVI